MPALVPDSVSHLLNFQKGIGQEHVLSLPHSKRQEEGLEGLPGFPLEATPKLRRAQAHVLGNFPLRKRIRKFGFEDVQRDLYPGVHGGQTTPHMPRRKLTVPLAGLALPLTKPR